MPTTACGGEWISTAFRADRILAQPRRVVWIELTPCRCQRLALLDDLADEEMLRHDEQVHDRKRLEIKIHEQKVRIVARGETFAFGPELAIQNLRAEFSLLALQFELFGARRTEEIGQRAVVGEGRYLCIAAMRAIRPRADPGFGPRAGILRPAGIGRLGFFEAEFHHDSVAKLF